MNNPDNHDNLTFETLSNQLKNNDFLSILPSPPKDEEVVIDENLIYIDKTTNPENIKRCKVCGINKDKIKYFSILRRNKDSYRDVCKDCECNYAKKRYIETKEYRKARIRFWQNENKEQWRRNNRRSKAAYLRRKKEALGPKIDKIIDKNNKNKDNRDFYDPLIEI